MIERHYNLEKQSANGKSRFYIISFGDCYIKTSYGVVGTSKPQGNRKEYRSMVQVKNEVKKILKKQLKNDYNIISRENVEANFINIDEFKTTKKTVVEGKSTKKSAMAIAYMNQLRFQRNIEEKEIDLSDPLVAEIEQMVQEMEG